MNMTHSKLNNFYNSWKLSNSLSLYNNYGIICNQSSNHIRRYGGLQFEIMNKENFLFTLKFRDRKRLNEQFKLNSIYFHNIKRNTHSSLRKIDYESQTIYNEHSTLVNHSDIRLKQITSRIGATTNPAVVSQVIHEVKESIEYGTLGGKGLTYALKYLKENKKYKEAWDLSIEAFEKTPQHQIIKYIPAISVVLLMIARKLGDKETMYIMESLINPQGANRLMWYSALNSIRETKDERVSQLFLKSYDKLKHEIKFNEKGLAILLQYFTTFGDMERSIEAFEDRFVNHKSPLFIKYRTSRLLSAYFHHLTVMGKRSKTRELTKNRIIHYYKTLCMDESLENYVAPDAYVISKVLSSCTSSFDLESARDFFQEIAVPFMKNNQLSIEDSSLISFPLVVPWIKHSDYNTVIWFFERYFNGDDKLAEWNSPLLNMVMQAYYSMRKYDKVIEIFDNYFLTGKRNPTSKTFNILLLTKCIQDQTFNLTEAMKTFHQYKDSLPTGSFIPSDYNAHLLQHKISKSTTFGVTPDGNYLDTKILKRRNIPPGLIKAIVTSLIERKNVEAAIQFFNSYCQDPQQDHFAMPPYRSIREIAQAILDIQNDPEKAITFIEQTKVDARFIPPIQLVQLIKRIEKLGENIDTYRIQRQIERFESLGTEISDLIGETNKNLNNEDEDELQEKIDEDNIQENEQDEDISLQEEKIIEERDEF